LRHLVGIVELVGAIGLVMPGLAGPAAAWLAADMAGATIVNATVPRNTTYNDNVWLTLILLAVFVVLAYGRREQDQGPDGGRPPGNTPSTALRRSEELAPNRTCGRYGALCGSLQFQNRAAKPAIFGDIPNRPAGH
jgi:hypothetical protein